MTVSNIFFSPTGGTKKVADLFASQLGDDIVNIDLTLVDACLTDCNSDIAIISAPVYNGRISDEIRRRISGIVGNSTPCVVIAVFGNRAYENALAELSKTATDAGYNVIAAIAAVAEHSIMRQFGTGRPNADDVATLKQYANSIKSKLNAKEANNLLQVPGIVSAKPTKDGQLVPKPGKECDACGVCAVKCPMSAIDLYNPQKVDKSKCISCMRCVAICPKQARKVSPIMVNLIAMLMKKAFIAPKPYEIYL